MKDTVYTRGISIAEASCRFACDDSHMRPSFGYVELRTRSTTATNGHWAIVVRHEPSAVGEYLPEDISILVPETVLRQAAPALRKAGHRGGIVGRTAADPNGAYEASILVPGLGIDVSWKVEGGLMLPNLGKILAAPARVGYTSTFLRLNFGYLAEIYRAAKDAQNDKTTVGVSILTTGVDEQDASRSQVILSGPRDWYAVLMPMVDDPKRTVASAIESVRVDYGSVRDSVLPLEAPARVDPPTVPGPELLPEAPAEVPAEAIVGLTNAGIPTSDPARAVFVPAPEAPPAPVAVAPRAKASPKVRKPAPPKAKPAPVPPPPPLPEADGVTVSRWAM